MSAEDERKRQARMRAAIERQRRKNQSRKAMDKRKAKQEQIERWKRGED